MGAVPRDLPRGLGVNLNGTSRSSPGMSSHEIIDASVLPSPTGVVRARTFETVPHRACSR